MGLIYLYLYNKKDLGVGMPVLTSLQEYRSGYNALLSGTNSGTYSVGGWVGPRVKVKVAPYRTNRGTDGGTEAYFYSV